MHNDFLPVRVREHESTERYRQSVQQNVVLRTQHRETKNALTVVRRQNNAYKSHEESVQIYRHEANRAAVASKQSANRLQELKQEMQRMRER